MSSWSWEFALVKRPVLREPVGLTDNFLDGLFLGGMAMCCSTEVSDESKIEREGQIVGPGTFL